MSIFLRSPFNYDRDAVSVETGLECQDKTLAQQQFLEDSDINTIVRRFKLTGQLPDNVRAPQYADFEGVFDYQTAMNAIRQAQESFNAMPADVRSRFANEPLPIWMRLANLVLRCLLLLTNHQLRLVM